MVWGPMSDTSLVKIEAQDQALGAGSLEIYQWMVSSWSLDDPTRKKYKEWVIKKSIYFVFLQS